MMDGALERFTATVRAHYGRVLQYTGDGMLAAFGAEEASEGDVESAVRAGLAIIEDAKAQSDEVRRRHGLPDFAVRAGLHTGTVLLGGGVDAESSIRGATVNVAARMEQSAPPGRLRISHDTYRHVRGLFEFSEPALIQVKGVEQPLRSYLVERAKPRAFRVASRGIEGVHTQMIGREAELEVVRSTFAATGSERQARALTIVGEAGLGKSRLLAEFQQTLDLDACWLLLGRAHPRSALHPYGVLRDMLLGPGADRRERLRRSGTPETDRPPGAALSRGGRGADPPDRPSDRPRLLDQPACPGTARRRGAPQGPGVRRLPALPAPPRRDAAGDRGARRPALGRRADARLHAPAARGEPRHAAAHADHDAADRVRAAGRVGRRRHRAPAARAEAARQGGQPGARRGAAAAPRRHPGGAARRDHRWRRRQPVLHGRAGQDADRRRRDRSRSRALARAAATSCSRRTCRPRSRACCRRGSTRSARASARRCRTPRWSATCSGTRRSRRSTPKRSRRSRSCCASSWWCAATAGRLAASTPSSTTCCTR